jgi:hypothetical protein
MKFEFTFTKKSGAKSSYAPLRFRCAAQSSSSAASIRKDALSGRQKRMTQKNYQSHRS